MYLKPKHLITSLLLILSLFSFAQKQTAESEKKTRVPSENIETFKRTFLIRPRFVYPLIWIDISSRLSGKGEKFIYKPTMPGVVGLSLKIKKVYVSAAVQLPPNKMLEKKYGKTKFRDINLNVQGRRLAWTMFYRDYKGFYLDNYNKYYPNWNEDSLGYPQLAGLRIIEGGLSLGFTFNNNFSLNSAFAQGERQKKSAGSLLMAISEKYQRINADTGFIPPTQGEHYPNLNKLEHGNFFTTILSIGYGYQVVVRKFHTTTVLMIGTGPQIQSYTLTDKRKFAFNVPTYANIKSQIGYNGDHFFTNLIYQTEFSTIPIKESKIRLFHHWLELGVGMRL